MDVNNELRHKAALTHRLCEERNNRTGTRPRGEAARRGRRGGGHRVRRCKADAEQTRLRILDAAELLFSERGIALTTLEQIARAAGVTRGAFYWHFKDKTAVLTALHESISAPQLALIRAASEQETLEDPLEFLETTGRDFLALFAADPRQQRMHIILSNAALPEETRAWLTALNAELWQVFRRLLDRADSANLLTDRLTPEEVTISLMVMFNGLLNEWLRGGKMFDLSRTGAKLLHHHISALRRADAP